MKKVAVKVIPNAKVTQIQESIDGSLKIWIKEKPVDGEANRALIKLLSKHFNVSKSNVVLQTGNTSRNKIFTIND